MNFPKRLLMGFAGAGLTAAILIPIAPRAARAVVATLVQVANTASNPAMTQDITRQAAQLVEVFCFWNNGASACYGLTPSGAQVSPYQVPSTQFLVVTSVETYSSGCSGVGGPFLYAGVPPRKSWHLPDGVFEFTYPSGFAIAPGSQLSIAPVNFGGASCSFDLSLLGYLTTN